MNNHPDTAWHTLDIDTTITRLNTDISTGLEQKEVLQRQATHGLNQITDGQKKTPLQIFFEQFTDFMIVILLIAAVISGVVGAPVDALAIVVIVVLNAIVGAIQQYRAEHAIAALKSMATPEATVLRNNEQSLISARDLVPGDIVLLEAGNIIPADIRFIQIESLEVDEAALTGESTTVTKKPDVVLDNDTVLADRINLGFKNTMITRGRGMAVVTAIGMQTEIGKIAALLGMQKSTKTPLQKRLTLFGKRLALIVLAICLLIFIAGLLRDEPMILMFLTAVSLAVAAIPEALPAVITVSLAMGARKMSQHFALVRNLPAVETLGSVTYICSDKTGTLTQNKMQVEQFFLDSMAHNKIEDNLKEQDLGRYFGMALALNNDIKTNNHSEIIGEPTELALYHSAIANGFNKQPLESEFPRIAELPFDSERKRMTTIHQAENSYFAFSKGAPESLIPLCSNRLTITGTDAMDAQHQLQLAEKLASDGYRVLAIAFRKLSKHPEDIINSNQVEQELTYLGLVALLDPPRDEVKKAVAECISAGITPIMITGDHPATALAIARRLGIANHDSKVITGSELANMSMQKFEQEVKNIRVYARVNPEQKTKIVNALQDKGEFVAMTGDGVNDAPALKIANIGIAMGKKGTDVARAAADMVLLDDNFATIIAAIKEGRRIFDNIRKFIKYTMTSNTGEILTLFLAPFLGLPIPLLPIHILWINLVTDGLPGLALSLEKSERGIMQRAPRSPDESIFANGLWQHMLWVGLLIAGLSIFSQAWAMNNGSDNWQTIVFTVLTFSQLVNALVVRSETDALMQIGIFTNKPLLGAIILTVVLQMAIIYLPIFNTIFKTSPLALNELILCFTLPLVVFVAVEIEKWFLRRQLNRNSNQHSV